MLARASATPALLNLDLLVHLRRASPRASEGAWDPGRRQRRAEPCPTESAALRRLASPELFSAVTTRPRIAAARLFQAACSARRQAPAPRTVRARLADAGGRRVSVTRPRCPGRRPACRSSSVSTFPGGDLAPAAPFPSSPRGQALGLGRGQGEQAGATGDERATNRTRPQGDQLGIDLYCARMPRAARSAR